MTIIVDSGATKTDWWVSRDKGDGATIQTEGINPFHQSAEDIQRIIETALLPQLQAEDQKDKEVCENIYFYGAGCTPQKAGIVGEALQTAFPKAQISVESDLLGAARALCGRTPGIACILGTGSNSCAYDGERITANVSPLGFILGDEGSGAVLGKRLVADCLKRQLPDDICQAFLDYCDLSPAEIINRVYRQPLANRFLASFTPFLAAHRERKEIHTLLLMCFEDFFQRNVMQYPSYAQVPVHFTGSIAYYFQQELKEVTQGLGITLGRVLKSPLKGLIDYHLKD